MSTKVGTGADALQTCEVMQERIRNEIESLQSQLHKYTMLIPQLETEAYYWLPSYAEYHSLTAALPQRLTPIESAVIAYKLQANSKPRTIQLVVGNAPTYKVGRETRGLRGWDHPETIHSLYRAEDGHIVIVWCAPWQNNEPNWKYPDVYQEVTQ